VIHDKLERATPIACGVRCDDCGAENDEQRAPCDSHSAELLDPSQ
jgi:hypothetical protein